MVVVKMEGSSFRSYEGLGNRLSMESGGDRGAPMGPRFLAVTGWMLVLFTEPGNAHGYLVLGRNGEFTFEYVEFEESGVIQGEIK